MSRDDSVADAFRRMADDFERGGSPLYAGLARELADDPVVAEICGERKPRWELPLRLFGAVHFLALSGEVDDPWPRFREVLATHRDRLTRFVAERPVQTNEVQRAWALLPAFLAIADARPLDLVELGASAGLNLLWDRYRYRYDGTMWGPGDAVLELAGESSGGPPRALLERTVEIRSRVGIDRAPVDVTSDEDARLLQAFVWADQRERLERLRRAIEVARRGPPRILAGDYLEVLPDVLADSPGDGLVVVFHSASTAYLPREDRERLRETIEHAGSGRPLAWISYEFVEDAEGRRTVGYDAFAVDARVWPGGETRRLARADGHGNRLRWLASP